MPTVDHSFSVPPAHVHGVLRDHVLADGLEVVLDLARSHGAILYDSRGDRELLDFFTCFSTLALGYNHPAFEAADVKNRLLTAAINKPANSDLYTSEMAAFVATFARAVPESHRHHLFFIEGGALAVENAMKAAFDWKHRKNEQAGRGSDLGNRILHFRDAFHGRSGYTLSVTNTDPTKIRYFPKFDWPRISNPKLSFPITDDVLAETQKAEDRAIEEIQQALVEHRHDIAGLLIEPIQAEGGDHHFRGEFLAKLRELADEEDFLLLFDEVQTGFGTTGKWWCFEHFGVAPDVFAFGKKTQVCGIAASARLDEIDGVFRVPSRINSTWGGNLVDMLRCQVIVETIERELLLDNATRVGATLLAGLENLARSFPGVVTNARGRGFFLAFDLPDKDTRNRALAAMKKHNLLGLACGSRSVRFRPALIVDQDTATEALRRAEKALLEVVSSP